MDQERPRIPLELGQDLEEPERERALSRDEEDADDLVRRDGLVQASGRPMDLPEASGGQLTPPTRRDSLAPPAPSP